MGAYEARCRRCFEPNPALAQEKRTARNSLPATALPRLVAADAAARVTPADRLAVIAFPLTCLVVLAGVWPLLPSNWLD